jgi:hypothetical protein
MNNYLITLTSQDADEVRFFTVVALYEEYSHC